MGKPHVVTRCDKHGIVYEEHDPGIMDLFAAFSANEEHGDHASTFTRYWRLAYNLPPDDEYDDER